MKFIGKSGKTIVEHLQDMLNEPALFAEMTGYQTDAVREAIKTLAEDNNVPVKQPDPITGLVPCGCGGKAKIWPGVWPPFEKADDYEVGCTKCEMTTGWVRGKQENAIKVWNTAMGWKGGAE